MGLFPHTKTPEEEVYYGRLKAMQIQLQPGMHILDATWCHRDEPGGYAFDHIVVTANYSGETPTIYTIGEDWAEGPTSECGGAALYFVPKLAHFETFVRCLAEAKQRGVPYLVIPGYDRAAHMRSGHWEKGKIPMEYLGCIADAWRLPEWRDAVIEALTQALIDYPPK